MMKKRSLFIKEIAKLILLITGDEYVNRFFGIWGLHLDRDEQ